MGYTPQHAVSYVSSSIISQLHVTLENTASPDCEGPSPVRIEPALQHLIPLLIKVVAPVRLFGVEELLDPGLHFRGSGRSSHKHQVARVLPLDTSVSQALSTRPMRFRKWSMHSSSKHAPG